MPVEIAAIPKLVLAVVAAFLLATACSADEPAAIEPGYVVVSEATLEPGDPVPVPNGPVVLTIGGEIATTNVGDTLQFDMATLESLGLIEYSVDDYQAEGRVASFSGVLASSVLDLAGASDTATNLRTVALNEYEVQVPIVDVTEYPVMIATSIEGNRMPVDAYGPTRIIYPTSSFELDDAVYGPRWIWQLALIEVG